MLRFKIDSEVNPNVVPFTTEILRPTEVMFIQFLKQLDVPDALIKCICSSKYKNKEEVKNLDLDTLTKLDSSIVKIEYSADIVNRPAQDVIRALGELYYYSGHCKVKGYCPYSWFSSWVFLLSKQYSKEYPIFNADILELILVT